MPISAELRYKLGDRSGYTVRQLNNSNTSSGNHIETQISNAQTRLNAAGVDSTEGKDTNFLIKALDIISRPGNAANSLIREFTNKEAGSTPGSFDPLQAWLRGIKGEEQVQGKDIMTDLSLESENGIFGGEAKWYNPSAAGAAGLALDIFNPLDPINWLGFGMGDDIAKGTSKGMNALQDAFGATKATQIDDILKALSHTDDIADTTKVVEDVADAAKVASRTENLGAKTVQELSDQILEGITDTDKLKSLQSLMEEGLKETGKDLATKLDYKTMKPLQVGLQNPLSIGRSGISIKTPLKNAEGATIGIPVVFPGKDIKSTFVNIPGSEYLTNFVGELASRFANTKVGGSLVNTLGKAFNTAFIPDTVPNAVVKKSLSNDLAEIMEAFKTNPEGIPLNIDQLNELKNTLGDLKLNNVYNAAEGMTDLSFSPENFAKSIGLNMDVDKTLNLLGDSPFEKNLTDIYEVLKGTNPNVPDSDLFISAAKVRKTLDMMYDTIPSGLKEYFTGVISPQTLSNSVDILGEDLAKTPNLAYVFEYDGVPVTLVVNAGEGFNTNAWSKLQETFQLLSEQPKGSLTKLKGEVAVSPTLVPGAAGMYQDGNVVLGDISKYSVTHELGHAWDDVAGTTASGEYKNAILNEAGKTTEPLERKDIINPYARKSYDYGKARGIKEDLAESTAKYLDNTEEFSTTNPARSSQIKNMIKGQTISEPDLAKILKAQRDRATKISQVLPVEKQVQSMIDSVDTNLVKMEWSKGDNAMKNLFTKHRDLLDKVNYSQRQWDKEVAALFEGIDDEGRKRVMDAAAQITGTEVPGKTTATMSLNDEDLPFFSDMNTPVFTSKLKEVVDSMPNSMPVDQFKKYLLNKGVKQDEMKWTFMDDFLDGKTKITKAEAQDWVRGNQLEVREVWRSKVDSNAISNTLSDWDDAGLDLAELGDIWDTLYGQGLRGEELRQAFATRLRELSGGNAYIPPGDVMEAAMTGGSSSSSGVKYSQYTQPGGQDYMELEFTLPQDYAQPKTKAMPAMSALEVEYEDLASRIDDIAEELGRDSQEYLTMNRRLQELEAQGISTTPVEAETYRSGHWDEQNVVAHTRFDTRYDDQGRKILYVDEIQSDWHQQGRDYGYLSLGENKNDSIRLERDRLTTLRLEYMDDSGPYSNLPWSERVSKAEEISNQIRELEYKFDSRVPDAPFKNNWDEFVEKRLLRYASDNGYDGIAWSTGKQQAERWGQSITEGIDTLQYNQPVVDSNPSLNMPGYLTGYKNGEKVFSQQLEPDKLADYVGKDLARKLVDETPDTYTIKPVNRKVSEGLVTDQILSEMDGTDMPADEVLKRLARTDYSGRMTQPSGYQVVDQNGNAWGYIYSSEQEAQKAIDGLESVGQRMKTVSNTNITVGGEGMRKFYDQQVPSNFSKLGKKFGLKVEELPLELGSNKLASNMDDILSDGLRENDAISDLFYEVSERGWNYDYQDDYIKTASKDIIRYMKNNDITSTTKDDIMGAIHKYTQSSNSLWDEAVENFSENFPDTIKRSTDLNNLDSEIYTEILETAPSSIDIMESVPEYISKQQGVWLSPDIREKLSKYSFPMFADQAEGGLDVTAGMSDKELNALDNMLKWRNSLVKTLQDQGIPVNELEKYVPFIPTRKLSKSELAKLKKMFGTGVNDLGEDIDLRTSILQDIDPNLKHRTTQATRPSVVNAELKKPWLTEDAAIAMSLRGKRAIKTEAVNEFMDEVLGTYGVSAEELVKFTDTKVPLPGYKAFQLSKDDAGNKVLRMLDNASSATAKGKDVIFLPQDVGEYLNNYTSMMFNRGQQGEFLKLFDTVNQAYKKMAYLWNPGHVARDFYGNVFNNYLAGVVSPLDYADGFKALNKMDGALSTVSGDIPFTKVYEEAEKRGIIDSVIAHEVPNASGKAEDIYSKTMRKATYATDGFTRMTNFVSNLKQGQSFAEAAITTKKYLFDYFDLTPFEKKYMKRIVPFYTWIRKNIPLQIENLITNPRSYARVADIQNAVAGEPIDWENKPEYVQDSMAVQPINSDNYYALNMPYTDLVNVEPSFRALGNLLSSVSPVIRAPIEEITNQRWWTGDQIESYKNEQTDIPILTTLLQLLGNENAPTMNTRGIAAGITDNLPLLSRASDLFDIASGKETSEAKKLSRLSTTAGGPAVYGSSSVNKSQNWQERQRLLELIQLLIDSGVDVPTIAELNEGNSISSNFGKTGSLRTLPSKVSSSGSTPSTTYLTKYNALKKLLGG